jgi:uncharacterized protein (TIRG00374 family)
MKRHLKTVVGVALSLLLLGWAMRDVSAAEVVAELRDADLVLLGASIVLIFGGLAIRAVRWGVFLRPIAPGIPFRPRYAATIVGFAANNVLPARIGEFARAVVLSRTARASASAAFATLVVERLFDGLVLAGLLFAAIASPGFPVVGTVGGVDPRSAARFAALATAAAGLFLLLLVLAPGLALRAGETMIRWVTPRRFQPHMNHALRSFLEGLSVLRSVPLFLVSALLAIGQWIFTAASYTLAFRAFGIDGVPFAGAVFLQSLVAFAAAIPSSPGFFGPFEAAAVAGLALWSVPKDRAVSFAVGYHLGGFVPVTLAGVYYVWRLGLRWREVKESGEDPRLEDGGPHRPIARESA